MKFDRSRYVLALPLLAAVCAVAALLCWWARPLDEDVSERLPGADQPPGAVGARRSVPHQDEAIGHATVPNKKGPSLKENGPRATNAT